MVPIIAKRLEKLVASYLSGRSTKQILLFAVDTIVNTLDHCQVVCAAFLDLRKAFDSLDHVTLLERFSAMGYMVLNFLGLLIIYLSVFNV